MDTHERKGFTLVELLVVIGIIGLLAAMLLPVLSKAKQAAQRSACVNNLKQLGIVLNLYAEENRSKFPPVENKTEWFMFDANVMYPEYLSDAGILACPSDPEYDPKKNFRLTVDTSLSDGSYGAATRAFEAGAVHPDCIGPLSYIYIGWMLTNDSDLLAGASIYTWLDSVLPISNCATDGWRGRSTNIASFGFTGSGNGGSSWHNRLSLGVGRYLISDINQLLISGESGASAVPLMWDQISTDISDFNHVPAGQHVLYLDGHVSFKRYDWTDPSFPTSALYATLNGLARDQMPAYCP